MSLTLLACLLSLATPTAAEDLAPGSPAPKIEVKTWVKGTPVKEFEKGKTYVVEFWATWCGPCIETIPHLTKLAKKYSDVTFMGVSILENNLKSEVQDFVKAMGEKMDYAVAYGGNEDGMAKTWFSAAHQSGIPCSFIVKDNRVMWIGHPVYLDKPLSEIKNGTFDVASAKKEFDDRASAALALDKLNRDFEACEKLYDSGDTKGAKARLTELEGTANGKAAGQKLRFKWLAIEDPAAFRKAATEMMNSSEGERVQLSVFAYTYATRVPEQCKWLISELTTDRFPPDWYPWLCGARMHRALKEYDKALECAARSRQVILDFQKANPDVPKGNALDVIKALEDEINKAKGGL